MNYCFKDDLVDKTIFVSFPVLGLFCCLFLFCSVLNFSVVFSFFSSPDESFLKPNKEFNVVRLFFQPYWQYKLKKKKVNSRHLNITQESKDYKIFFRRKHFIAHTSKKARIFQWVALIYIFQSKIQSRWQLKNYTFELKRDS